MLFFQTGSGLGRGLSLFLQGEGFHVCKYLLINLKFPPLTVCFWDAITSSQKRKPAGNQVTSKKAGHHTFGLVQATPPRNLDGEKRSGHWLGIPYNSSFIRTVCSQTSWTLQLFKSFPPLWSLPSTWVCIRADFCMFLIMYHRMFWTASCWWLHRMRYQFFTFHPIQCHEMIFKLS
jgi:hypothetical protein